ncbi:unnamed protein product [Effrenium voratum]|nr:unnamed protein product [Effrenium voratum]
MSHHDGERRREAVLEAVEEKIHIGSRGGLSTQLQDEVEKIWVVTGGVNPDGIVVRTSVELGSAELGRLALQAKVRQLRILKGRLQYQLLSGHGPETGWVSLKVGGKELLEKAPEERLVSAAASADGSAANPQAPHDEVSPTNDGSHQVTPLPQATELAAQFEAKSGTLWEVTGGLNPEGLLVRASMARSSLELPRRLAPGARLRQRQLVEGRLCYELVSGEGPETGWVSLRANGCELLRRILTTPKASEDPLLNTDFMGIPRGACTSCRQCTMWVFDSLSLVEWGGNDTKSTIEERRNSYDRKMRGYQEKRKGQSALCERCQCPAEQHLDLSGWLEAVRTAARPFRETYEEAIRKDPAYRHLGRAMGTARTRRLPRAMRIPADSLTWQHREVAMFLLSLGVYDPRRDARKQLGDAGHANELISVICPTSEKRHAFHPLLYENFCLQSYEDKELVVIDTGAKPSDFLLRKAAEDSRVIYYHFVVDDSRENDPMSAVILDDGFSVLTGEDVKKRRGLSFKPRGGWSLGFKRNLCCHLARGAIIAHFDDDDLYAANYLSRMSATLAQRKRAMQPAAATLSEWHMMDVKDQRFGFFDPKTDNLLSHEQRESFMYGYGFSFVYTRSAWETVPFPDTEWSEDGDFMGRLQLRRIPIELVRCPQALAAHTHHSDSTSGGELCGNIRLGYAVQTPEEFKSVLPTARRVALDTRVRQGSQHPLRAEMHRVLDGGFGYAPSEVRWHEKEQFLRNNPDVSKRSATLQYKEWQGSFPRGGLAFGPPARHPGFAFGGYGEGTRRF